MKATHRPQPHHPNDPAHVHWVVVADASRMQVFAADVMLEALLPLEGRTHPASRLPTSELVSDDRGATRDGITGIRSRVERHTEPHRGAIDDFAREIGHLLHDARVAARFERLVLVAPPQFLGAIRAHLDHETAKTVLASFAHEWTRLPLPELAARIRAELPGTLPD